MGYGFDWAWSGLGLVFMGLGWAGLKILEPIPNTGAWGLSLAKTIRVHSGDVHFSQDQCHSLSFISLPSKKETKVTNDNPNKIYHTYISLGRGADQSSPAPLLPSAQEVGELSARAAHQLETRSQVVSHQRVQKRVQVCEVVFVDSIAVSETRIIRRSAGDAFFCIIHKAETSV